MVTVIVAGPDDEANWAVVADLVARSPAPRDRVVLISPRTDRRLAGATEKATCLVANHGDPIDVLVVESCPALWLDDFQYKSLLALAVLGPLVEVVLILVDRSCDGIPLPIKTSADTIVRTPATGSGQALVHNERGLPAHITVLTRRELRARMATFLFGTARRGGSPVKLLVPDVLAKIAGLVVETPYVDSGEAWAGLGSRTFE